MRLAWDHGKGVQNLNPVPSDSRSHVNMHCVLPPYTLIIWNIPWAPLRWSSMVTCLLITAPLVRFLRVGSFLSLRARHSTNAWGSGYNEREAGRMPFGNAA